MTTTQEIIDRLENVSLEFVGDVRAVKAAADRLRELEAELMRQRLTVATVDNLFKRLLSGDSDECVAAVREFESLGYDKTSIMPYLKRAEQWREDFGCGGQAVRDAIEATGIPK